MKDNNPTTENESSRLKRRKRKELSPYKKGKYAISKLDEYENYLNNLELMSRGGDLKTE